MAPAFLQSVQQPPPGTPLSKLLEGGHFRRAADGAVNDLRKCPSENVQLILKLLYTRLACLILVARPDIAAQEAVPLLDLLARNPPQAKDLVPQIPWELRLLLVRLQSIGATDGGRRGIMALYALAAEVRTHVRDENVKDEEKSMWARRLTDLGLRVADALVEMGELETAHRHLDTLEDVDADEIASRKALLRARVGDVAGARVSVSKLQNPKKQAALDTLLKVADGDFSSAGSSWQTQQDSEAGPLTANNLAVSLLYTGRIQSSHDILEELAQTQPGFPALLFNLSTVYELCTERAMDRKTSLISSMVGKAPAPDAGGWEKATFEFKL